MNTKLQPPVSFEDQVTPTFTVPGTKKYWNQSYIYTETGLFFDIGPDDGSINSSISAQVFRFHNKDIDLNHQKQNVVFRKHLVYREFFTRSSDDLKKGCVESGNTFLNYLCKNTDKLSTFCKIGTTNDRIDPKHLFSVLEAYLINGGLLKENLNKQNNFPGIFSFDDIKHQIHLNKIKIGDPFQLFTMASKSKSSSLSLQTYINDCSGEDLEQVTDKMICYIPFLITHRCGNFFVQRLLVKSQAIFQLVVNIAQENFAQLAINEFSSRVLQLVIEKSESFCKFALSYFKNNLKMSLYSKASCHLIVACIKNTKDVSKIQFVNTFLVKNPIYMRNKFYQRILIAYIETASDSQVHGLASTLGAHTDICKLLENKTSGYLLLALIQRADATTLETIYELLTNDVSRLLEARYFLMVMQKLSQSQGQCPEFLANVFNILTQLNTSTVVCLSRNDMSMSQYLFVLLLCSNEDLESDLDRFLSRQDIKVQMSRFMNSSIYNKGAHSVTSFLGLK